MIGFLKKIGEALLTIIISPLILIIIIGFLLYTPIDYIGYRKTQYYKDTKEKYTWLATNSYCITLYEAIKKADLPVKYFRSNNAAFTGYGYFLYKDILILNEYDAVSYDEESGAMTVEIEDVYVKIEDAVKEDISECNEFLKSEAAKKALVIIANDELSEADLPILEDCKFLLVADINDITDALQEFIQQNP